MPLILQHIHFDIVGGCQLKCVGCPNSMLDTSIEFIDVKDFETCLSNIDATQVDNFRLFNYGEPLLYPRLDKIGEAILKVKHFEIKNLELSTNSQRVRWDNLKKFLNLNILNTMVISCDGDGTAESYEKLRPPAKWNRLISFFDKVSEIKEKHQLDFKIITRTIVENDQHAKKWREVLSPYPIEPEFREWIALPGESKNMTQKELSPGTGSCFFVSSTDKLYANHRGDVVPCCAHPGAGYLGSLLTQKYSQIIESNERSKFIQLLENKRSSMPICRTCEFGSEYIAGRTFQDEVT